MELCCSIKRVQLLALIFAVIAIVVVLVILLFYNYPTFARNRVIEEIVFKNGSMALERFRTTKELESLRVEFYFWNVTNVNDVLYRNAKINVNEVGPFVYHELKYKEFLNNDQVEGLITYKLKKRFIFRPDLSVSLDSTTRITWPNVPLLALQGYLENISITEPIYILMNSYIKTLNEPAFIRDTVENFLFKGSYREIFAKLQSWDIFHLINPWPLPNNKFALLYKRNDTWDPTKDHVFTMSAGFGLDQTYHDLNSYVLMDGKPNLPFWASQPKDCNALNGTDGQFFPPFLDNADELHVYSSDICRKITLKFRQKTTISGVPVRKYSFDENNLQAPTKNPKNQCYCIAKKDGIPSRECQLDGLIDLSTCVTKNLMASGAHFLRGDEELRDRVTGISKPDSNLHEPIIYVEPNTGLTVSVKVPIQLNIRLKKNKFSNFQFFKDINPIILPLVWISEKAELSQEQASLLRSKLMLLDSWFVIMVLGGVIILIITILVIASALCIKYRKSRATTVARPARETDPLIAKRVRRPSRRRSDVRI